MLRARLALCFAVGLGVGLALLAMPTHALAQPVVVETILRTTPGGTIRGYLATVDLTDPTVEIVVDTPGTTVGQITSAKTDTWRSTVGARLAVNANYFGTASGSTLSIVGLAMSNGQIVSNARQFGTTLPGDPAITFSANRVPNIGYIAPGATAGVWDAVAGVGPSNTDTDPGTLLITDGVNTGATARVTPLVRDPRTAVGINQAGTRLYIIVIDGRQSTWSVGVTLPELADLLLAKGVWRAINLDGGSSSSFVYVNDLGAIQQNKPSGGTHAAVATHMGIKINNPAPITDRVVRPIRGAWYRPPGSTTSFPNTPDFATLDTALLALAQAGIQDLFYENFFWGRTTNNSSVYNDRFSTDHLAYAITQAARYGIRVHAWNEIGYQGFGSSADYLFNANPATNGDQNGRAGNPDWLVVFAPGTVPTVAGVTSGDQVSQKFVNLIHPGVRSRLSEFVAELAAYPGLEGIQIDYCRFPLDPNTTDAFPAPWSYDTWTRAQFQADGFGDPVSTALKPTGSNSSQWTSFTTWRKAGITNTINSLVQSLSAINPGVSFSGAIFPDPNNSSQLTKMQDWPTWVANYALPIAVPMCYSSTQANITGEINSALTLSGNARFVAGLAYPGLNASHPSLTTQINAMLGANRRIEEFVWFDANSFVGGAGSLGATNRNALRAFVNATNGAPGPNATQLQGDVTATGNSNGFDGFIDARDLQWLDTVYTGTPVTRTAANDRCDLNRDGVIDATDRLLLRRAFGRFHFGADDVVDARDIQACINAFNPGPAPVAGILNLWDLNGDGRVDYLDQLIVHSFLTVPVAFDYDVTRNGSVDLEDLYVLSANFSIDVNRDGLRDSGDVLALEQVLRTGETQGNTAGRR